VTPGRAVSRETASLAPPPPPVAIEAFGAQLPSAVAFADLLCGPGIVRGLVGPGELERIWPRHLLNCVVIKDLIPAGASVDDVGSGAGLPGIVLAIARPDLDMTLVEPLLRRTTFLREVVEAMELGNVQIARERAQERARTSRNADVVTARAVASLDRLGAWCLPLLRPDGVLLAMKGESAGEDLAAALPALERAGAAEADLIQCGVGVVDPPTTVVRIRRGHARGGRVRLGRADG
jgi:16S rRNA (guanine527-N7)-methyltransferase